SVVYDIHISNDGDAIEDITFRLQALARQKNLTIATNPPTAPPTATPVYGVHAGPFGPNQHDNVNVDRFYWVREIRGALNGNNRQLGFLTNAQNGSAEFAIPLPNFGPASV